MINPRKTGPAPITHTARGRGHGRVTLAEVAAHSGVTTMTVSRFLRSPGLVAAETARRIALALEETGYIPNLQAGGLASGRSQAVAVIVPNMAHSIFADTLHGLGAGLGQAGLQMLVSATGYSLAQEQEQVRSVLGWAPAAVVVTGRTHLPATLALLTAAHARGTPVVEIWDQSPAHESQVFHQIGFNHFAAGALMASALIDRGYTRLAFLDSAVIEDFRAHERAEGFIAECERRGITVEHLLAQTGDPLTQGGASFHHWCERTAVAGQRCAMGFANDLLACGALLYARTTPWRIPEELALLGFGDFPLGRYCAGGLSTLQINGEQIGQSCAQFIAHCLRPDAAAQADKHSPPTFEPNLLWRAT